MGTGTGSVSGTLEAYRVNPNVGTLLSEAQLSLAGSLITVLGDFLQRRRSVDTLFQNSGTCRDQSDDCGAISVFENALLNGLFHFNFAMLVPAGTAMFHFDVFPVTLALCEAGVPLSGTAALLLGLCALHNRRVRRVDCCVLCLPKWPNVVHEAARRIAKVALRRQNQAQTVSIFYKLPLDFDKPLSYRTLNQSLRESGANFASWKMARSRRPSAPGQALLCEQ